jgi:hypothetical protein
MWACENRRTILDALRQYTTAATIAAFSALNAGVEFPAVLAIA